MPYLPAVLLLMLIYMASMIGFTTPHQQGWFLYYTPHMVVLNALLLVLYHRPYRWSFFAFLGLSCLWGTAVEVLALRTGAVYGAYAFGDSLGPLVFGMPWVMPLYWWVLAYSSASLSSQLLSARTAAKVILGTLLMAGLALLIQQVAAPLDFWKAESGWYYGLTWGCSGLVLQLAWHRWKVADSNRIAGFVYGGLLIFFLGVWLFLNM